MDKINKIIAKLRSHYAFIYHYNKEGILSSLKMMEETDGCAYARFYWYSNENTLYIEGLSVDKKERKNGIATTILEMAEVVAMNLAFEKIGLKVNTKTWVYKWYKRIGFVDFVRENEINMWMYKYCDNSNK